MENWWKIVWKSDAVRPVSVVDSRDFSFSQVENLDLELRLQVACVATRYSGSTTNKLKLELLTFDHQAIPCELYIFRQQIRIAGVQDVVI